MRDSDRRVSQWPTCETASGVPASHRRVSQCRVRASDRRARQCPPVCRSAVCLTATGMLDSDRRARQRPPTGVLASDRRAQQRLARSIVSQRKNVRDSDRRARRRPACPTATDVRDGVRHARQRPTRSTATGVQRARQHLTCSTASDVIDSVRRAACSRVSDGLRCVMMCDGFDEVEVDEHKSMMRSRSIRSGRMRSSLSTVPDFWHRNNHLAVTLLLSAGRAHGHVQASLPALASQPLRRITIHFQPRRHPTSNLLVTQPSSISRHAAACL